MIIVNIVSQIHPAVWQREMPEGLAQEFIHSAGPTTADIHVVYGIRQPLKIPNSSRNIVFVASEPPDIRVYNTAVLARYGAVVGPPYEYLSDLPIFHPITAIAPWWVGVKAGGEAHYASVDGSVALGRKDFERGFSPQRDVVTTIVSQKNQTPLQQQRLRLVDYLSVHLSQFEVYGLAAERVQDKADVLGTSRYHVAIENSSHPGYWTEKLSDPILMDNVVFYGGHPSVSNYFSRESVLLIDPWNPEKTYRAISEAREKKTWESTADARGTNRKALLERLSFHRELSRFLSQHEWEASRGVTTVIPGQHLQNRIKKLADPLYRRLFPSKG
jgi:hypothetical protein